MKKKKEIIVNNSKGAIVGDFSKYPEISKEIIDLDDLHAMICELRFNYMEKYHREPKILVVPESIDYLIRLNLATTFSKISQLDMYMGMLLVPSPAIKYYEYMKVY